MFNSSLFFDYFYSINTLRGKIKLTDEIKYKTIRSIMPSIVIFVCTFTIVFVNVESAPVKSTSDSREVNGGERRDLYQYFRKMKRSDDVQEDEVNFEYQNVFDDDGIMCDLKENIDCVNYTEHIVNEVKHSGKADNSTSDNKVEGLYRSSDKQEKKRSDTPHVKEEIITDDRIISGNIPAETVNVEITSHRKGDDKKESYKGKYITNNTMLENIERFGISDEVDLTPKNYKLAFRLRGKSVQETLSILNKLYEAYKKNIDIKCELTDEEIVKIILGREIFGIPFEEHDKGRRIQEETRKICEQNNNKRALKQEENNVEDILYLLNWLDEEDEKHKGENSEAEIRIGEISKNKDFIKLIVPLEKDEEHENKLNTEKQEIENELDHTIRHLRRIIFPKSFAYIDNQMMVKSQKWKDIDINNRQSKEKFSFGSAEDEISSKVEKVWIRQREPFPGKEVLVFFKKD